MHDSKIQQECERYHDRSIRSGIEEVNRHIEHSSKPGHLVNTQSGYAHVLNFSAFSVHCNIVTSVSPILKCTNYKRLQMFAYQPYPVPSVQAFSSDVPKIKKNILISFDFDHTIVDDNTDIVARGLVPKDSLTIAEEVYRNTDSWTLYMGEIFKCLHRLNVSKEKIISAVQAVPPIKYMDSLLRHLSDNEFEVIVISDSNSVFINEWFKSYKLKNIVKKVVTNPAWFDSTGLLNIEFYQNQSFCNLSEPNLCKGYVLQTYISDRKIESVMFDHVVFIGDGSNDFCPTVKLSEKDLVFPRIDYALHKQIKQNQHLVKAEVHPWKDGSDIIKVFQEKFGMKVV